ncbi:MAG: family N-acetyltransferase [Candidatus Berkelbacteria bacterium]|nr:family N-acetyltransferase [Candidatus Berkelbacteria bacterium]
MSFGKFRFIDVLNKESAKENMTTKLRKILPSDKNFFAKWWRDKDLIALTSGDFSVLSDTDINGYFATKLKNQALEYMIDFNGQTIGNISLDKRENGWYEIQIIIGEKDFWGQGHGTESIKQMVDLAKERKISKIYLEVRPDNIRAIRAYEKAGFFKKGIQNYPKNRNLPQTLRMELVT